MVTAVVQATPAMDIGAAAGGGGGWHSHGFSGSLFSGSGLKSTRESKSTAMLNCMKTLRPPGNSGGRHVGGTIS